MNKPEFSFMAKVLIALGESGIHPDLNTWTSEKILFLYSTLADMRKKK